MAADIFAKIGDIKGESLDSKHKNEVEILSWSWGVQNAGTIGRGGGAGQGKATFNDFNFTHRIDKASPVLLKACATGQHIKEATITVRKAGKGQQEFLTFSLTDILVSSYQTGASASSEPPTDSVSLNFAKIQVEYKEQKADGSLGETVKVGWDRKANKQL
jgi:type VI secretion system secreted protein Hcp